MNNVEKKIIELVAIEAAIDPSLVQPSTTMSDIGVPSISQMEIMFALEEEFDIELLEEMDGLSLDGLAQRIQKLINEKNAS